MGLNSDPSDDHPLADAAKEIKNLQAELDDAAKMCSHLQMAYQLMKASDSLPEGEHIRRHLDKAHDLSQELDV